MIQFSRTTRNKQGFTLIEVVMASFVLSVAIISLLFVSSRALVLNRQAARMHGALLLAEDVFSGVQRAIYENVLNDKPIFGIPFGVCKNGRTCQMGVNSSLTTPFQYCDGGCHPVVVTDGDSFLVQDSNETATGIDTGYEREIQMEILNDWEMLVTVTVRWDDRGISFERTYQRTFIDWYSLGAYYEYGRVIPTVVECSSEADLPNWGASSPSAPDEITKTTAADYVSAHPNCWLSSGWNFQWGYLTWGQDEGNAPWTIDENKWVDSALLSVVGPNDGSGGPGTYTYNPETQSYREPYTNEWRSFGPTDEDGRTAIIIPQPIADNFVIRLETRSGYVPFSYYFDDDDWANDPPQDNVSAEMYCRDDVRNYDNYDYIEILPGGNVYYCVAFVARL